MCDNMYLTLTRLKWNKNLELSDTESDEKEYYMHYI